MAEGRTRKGRVARSNNKEEDHLVHSFYSTLLYEKLQQVVSQATEREVGGCLLPGGVCKKTGRLVADVLKEKHPYMRLPSVENSTFTDFEEHKDVPEMVPFNLSEKNIT